MSGARVKLCVTYDTGSTCYRTECVVDSSVAETCVDDWMNPGLAFVRLTGILNDADGNKVTYIIEREGIKCMDILELNNL